MSILVASYSYRTLASSPRVEAVAGAVQVGDEVEGADALGVRLGRLEDL
jgi:hypothetical protein